MFCLAVAVIKKEVVRRQPLLQGKQVLRTNPISSRRVELHQDQVVRLHRLHASELSGQQP